MNQADPLLGTCTLVKRGSKSKWPSIHSGSLLRCWEVTELLPYLAYVSSRPRWEDKPTSYADVSWNIQPACGSFHDMMGEELQDMTRTCVSTCTSAYKILIESRETYPTSFSAYPNRVDKDKDAGCKPPDRAKHDDEIPLVPSANRMSRTTTGRSERR